MFLYSAQQIYTTYTQIYIYICMYMCDILDMMVHVQCYMCAWTDEQTNKETIYRVNETSNQPCGNLYNTALINLNSMNTNDWYTLPQPWKVTQSTKLHWHKLAYLYFLYIFDTNINTSTNETASLNQG
jgi:hypothetical protein